MPCLNTSVSVRGARYPDPKSAFLASEPNRPAKLELKNLAGATLDAVELALRRASFPSLGKVSGETLQALEKSHPPLSKSLGTDRQARLPFPCNWRARLAEPSSVAAPCGRRRRP
ncbi:MAG: hypothetical protein NTY53_21535 [Kiritimatiellaeota bacterium]|nr:hypothetical protein [Kiritimatiellota bacterium]